MPDGHHRVYGDDEQVVSRLAGRLLDRWGSTRAAFATSWPPPGWPMTGTGIGTRPQTRPQIARAKIANIPWDGVRAAGGGDTPPEPERAKRDRRRPLIVRTHRPRRRAGQ